MSAKSQGVYLRQLPVTTGLYRAIKNALSWHSKTNVRESSVRAKTGGKAFIILKMSK